jgi:uracil permease
MSDLIKQEGVSGQTVILGLQHTFVMFGATVLVPIITGLDAGVALFAAGVGTLLFHVLTKFKVPVFLGSSFAFIPPIMAVAGNYGGTLRTRRVVSSWPVSSTSSSRGSSPS